MNVPPGPTLVQLTDLHLTAAPGPADDALSAAAAMLAAGDARPEAILLTGDLSEDGSPTSYRRVRDVLGLVSERLGAPLVVLPGNHDDVPTLRRELLGGGPTDRVVLLGGLRVVVLDSTVPGAHHGALRADQLAWLGDVLRNPAPAGTVLALHHPPLGFEDPVLDRLALREPGALARVLADTDVRLIACGHAHQLTAGTLAGVPVWCGPALTMTTDALPPAGRARSFVGGGGLTRIAVRRASATATFVPLLDDPVVRYDQARSERLAMLAALEAEAGA